MQGSYYPRACMKARKSLKSIRNQDAVQKASQTPEEVKQRIAEAAASGATALYLSNFDLTEVPEESGNSRLWKNYGSTRTGLRKFRVGWQNCPGSNMCHW